MAGEKFTSYRQGPGRRTPDVVAVTQALIKEPTHTNTAPLREYLSGFAADHGLEFAVVPTREKNGTVDSANPSFLVGKDLDNMPRVLAASHVDTVRPWNKTDGQFDPHGGTIDEGKLYGRGASDAKGGAASMLVALAERGTPRTAVLLTAREETDLAGARSAGEHFKKVQEKDPAGKTLLVLDGGTDSEFATGSRGVLEADIRIKGQTEHTARPIDFIDAVAMREKIIANLKERVGEMPEDPLLGRTVFRRTGDASGMREEDGSYSPKVNNVPDGASALLTFRLTRAEMDGETLDSAKLGALITDMVAEHAGDGLELEEYRERLYVPGFISDPTKVRWIVDLAESATGKQLIEWKYGERGLSEVNHIMDVFGPDTGLMIVGPGKQGTFHKPDEYTEVESLQQYAHVYGEVFDRMSV